MKLLYLTPQINQEGGLPKVLSVRTNYFIEKFDYQINILTQNEGFKNPFFDFNNKINFIDIDLNCNNFQKLFRYKSFLKKQIQNWQPDIIIVCDFGLKAFLIPFLLDNKIPIFFEAHGSLYNETKSFNNNFFTQVSKKIKYKYKLFCARKFDKFIALSNESLAEWNVKNGIVIPNPIWFKNDQTASLQNKKALIIARHSFEKGLNKLIPIWKIIAEKHPDWQLDIYGKSSENKEIEQLIKDSSLENNINLLPPTKDIISVYKNYSMYLMTSRQEGFPMVLLEAIASGLPCIAYDCPVGPRSIIQNNYNGFLIENNNSKQFVSAIISLIENVDLRIEMGKNAKLSSKKYDLETILNQWNDLFLETMKHQPPKRLQ